MDHAGTRGGLLDSLIKSEDLDSFLKHLVDVAVERLSGIGVAHCSVTLTRDRGHRNPLTLVCSDETAALMDEIQYTSGEGPCSTALETGRAAWADDLEADPRWPLYRQAMKANDIRSVMAVCIPLAPGAEAVLNCYASEPRSFTADAMDEVRQFADLASRSLQFALKLAGLNDRALQLTEAMESRSTINVAAGVVMAQTGGDQKAAIKILKKASMNRQVKLHDVAASVIARFTTMDPDLKR